MKTERYRERALREGARERESGERGIIHTRIVLLIKQSAAVLAMIAAGALVYASGFEFGIRCIEALGRAAKHEFAWADVWADICGLAGEVRRFWIEIF